MTLRHLQLAPPPAPAPPALTLIETDRALAELLLAPHQRRSRFVLIPGGRNQHTDFGPKDAA